MSIPSTSFLLSSLAQCWDGSGDATGILQGSDSPVQDISCCNVHLLSHHIVIDLCDLLVNSCKTLWNVIFPHKKFTLNQYSHKKFSLISYLKWTPTRSPMEATSFMHKFLGVSHKVTTLAEHCPQVLYMRTDHIEESEMFLSTPTPAKSSRLLNYWL